MDIQSEKLQLIQWLAQLTDEKLVKRLQEFRRNATENDNGTIVGYTVDGKPLTKDAYDARLAKSMEDFSTGRSISQEDLEKEVENW